MPVAAFPDIVHLVKFTCLSLKSYALCKGVEITFLNTRSYIAFDHKPAEIIHCVSELILRIISYMPAQNKITVETCMISNDGLRFFRITVHNTGINLSAISEITNNITPVVTTETCTGTETRFVVEIPIPGAEADVKAEVANRSNGAHSPVFFQEVRKSLQPYFFRTNSYADNLKDVHPRKAAFLRRINQCIFENLADENFDVAALGRHMSLSRTQLFRQLKTIISHAPSSYIKSMRLQKAMELLEAGDLSVSEVAYKTGFKTSSHFTKVFADNFGIRPSAINTASKKVTNE